MNKIKLMLVLAAAEQLFDTFEEISRHSPSTLTIDDLNLLLEKWRQYKSLMSE